MDYDALYKLTHGLYIIGAKDNEKFAGCVVDAVMQVANKPWVIAVSCTNTSYTKGCIDKTREFSLSVLGKKVDPFVIANFGFQSSRDVNKWANIDYCVIDGLPYLRENLATLHCKVLQQVVFESNTMFVAEVFGCVNNENDEALTYADYRSYFKKDVIKSFEEMKKGNIPAPKPIETKQVEAQVVAKTAEKHMVCSVCEYIYNESTPFAELPEDWTCPVCGVDKSFFVLK